MKKTQPLVSCIMPTADRAKFVPYAIEYFLRQDYPHKELIIIDDGLQPIAYLIPEDQRIRYFYTEPLGTIGIKRNYACSQSSGDIIMHWDDDDWYATDWISRQAEALRTSGASISGLNRIVFFSPSLDRKWLYEDLDEEKPWLCGATMAYKKTLWESYPFTDTQVGEDCDFVRNSGAVPHLLNYPEGFRAIVHSQNTSIRPVRAPLLHHTLLRYIKN